MTELVEEISFLSICLYNLNNDTLTPFCLCDQDKSIRLLIFK